jgi:hypothetical protein
MRNALLFLTALLLALTAGRAFWVWLGENPFDMSGATHVEFFQQPDQRIALPIAVTGSGRPLLARMFVAMYLVFAAMLGRVAPPLAAGRR